MLGGLPKVTVLVLDLQSGDAVVPSTSSTSTSTSVAPSDDRTLRSLRLGS